MRIPSLVSPDLNPYSLVGLIASSAACARKLTTALNIPNISVRLYEYLNWQSMSCVTCVPRGPENEKSRASQVQLSASPGRASHFAFLAGNDHACNCSGRERESGRLFPSVHARGLFS